MRVQERIEEERRRLGSTRVQADAAVAVAAAALSGQPVTNVISLEDLLRRPHVHYPYPPPPPPTPTHTHTPLHAFHAVHTADQTTEIDFVSYGGVMKIADTPCSIAVGKGEQEQRQQPHSMCHHPRQTRH